MSLRARLRSHYDVVHGVLLAFLFVSIFLRVPLLSVPLLSACWHGGASVLLLPAVGAVLWFLLVHGALQRESLLLSRLASRSERRARRTRMATKAFVLFSVALFAFSPFLSNIFRSLLATKGMPFFRWLDPQHLQQTALASSIVNVLFERIVNVATITVGILFLPASMRSTAVLHGGPVIAITSRCVRSAVAFARHNDPFYFDKLSSCDVYVGYVCPQLFVMAGFFALVDTPTLYAAAALFFVALVAVAFGACRNDMLEVCAVLAYTAVLVALMVRSRTSVRLHVNHHRRGDRENRIVADGVSNWAAPSTASNDDDDGDGNGDRWVEAVEGGNGCGGGMEGGGGGEGVNFNSDEDDSLKGGGSPA